ncbi:MAG: FAD-dependent oxidoreductase [Pseudomonadota bacterium]
MDPSTTKTVAIIGGGQAGAQAATSLRQWGFEGDICLVGEETALPYQRPPLSKAYFKGEMDEERLYFKTAEWYEQQRIDVLTGIRAEKIDRTNRLVDLSNGGHMTYDALIISTGSRPRPLPVDGADLANVFELRGLDDVKAMVPQATAGKHIVIVGAGYIGLEAAAVARQLGLEVTVLEMEPRILARVTSPLMSKFYTDLHESNGVSIHTGARLERLSGENGNVTTAHLADGTEIPCHLVLVGIGIVPNQDIAEEAGIACADGILTDRDARTNDRHIFAAGDCTVRPLVHYGRTGRLESVHNAIEQGKLAAASILGRPRPAEDTPWFWSDQYDVKLQIAGLSDGHDEVIVRGDIDTRSFAAFYYKNGRLIAVDAVNAAPEFLVAKKLIMLGNSLAPSDLSDTSVSMKELAARAA